MKWSYNLLILLVLMFPGTSAALTLPGPVQVLQGSPEATLEQTLLLRNPEEYTVTYEIETSGTPLTLPHDLMVLRPGGEVSFPYTLTVSKGSAGFYSYALHFKGVRDSGKKPQDRTEFIVVAVPDLMTVLRQMFAHFS